MGTHVQGIRYSTLAREYGTPLYVYDADVLADRFLGLRERLHPAVDLFYSLKANPNVAICAYLRSLGAGAEVSSLLELLIARRAGVTPPNIVFPGPGKSRNELTACLAHGIRAVICESVAELELIDDMAGRAGFDVPVAIRVNPTFGRRPAKYGIDEEQLLASPGLARRFNHARIVGVHVYSGTRLVAGTVVAERSALVLNLAERLADRLDFPLELVDIGGGLGVPYFEGEREVDPDELTARLNPIVDSFRDRRPGTRLIMELGRYLVASAGTYLVGVRYVKTSHGHNFAVVDGGTHHHMAAKTFGASGHRNFPIRLLDRPDAGAQMTWTVAGPLCAPNDTLVDDVDLPPLRPGDLLGVLESGAYGPTASPGLLLGHGFPAEVMVHNGTAHIVRERDDLAELLAKQFLPTLTRDAPEP